MQELTYQTSTPGGKIKFDNAARFDVAAGYKWASGFRLELEDGYASYKVTSATTPAGVRINGAGGHVAVGTVMGVIAYDIPMSPQFAFTVGAGAGAPLSNRCPFGSGNRNAGRPALRQNSSGSMPRFLNAASTNG